MDMEHEIKKAAPSAQQAADIDTPEFQALLDAVAHCDLAPERNALIAHIRAWAAATPAQPIAPQELTADLINLLNAIRPNFGDVGTRDVDVARQRQRIDKAIIQLGLIVAHDGREHPTPRPVAQPIAVSAPTDERAAFEEWAKKDGSYDLRGPTWTPISHGGVPHTGYVKPYENMRAVHTFEGWQAASAAAPVSGPSDMTEAEARAALMAMSPDELASRVQGSAAPVSGQGATLQRYFNSEFGIEKFSAVQHKNMPDVPTYYLAADVDAYIDSRSSNEEVSGQGVGIADDPGFWSLLGEILTGFNLSHDKKRDIILRVAAYIDSRPRSEDSRAKVPADLAELAEEVADVLASQNWRGDLVERLRDLASTTPQKADNE